MLPVKGNFFLCRSRKDLDKTQAKSHEKEVTNVSEIITNMINPFEVEGNSLVNIASGVVAPTDVCKDMLSAKDIGEKSV